MADITFSGLASGMDTDSIVSKLMKIERFPIDRLEAQLKSEKEKLEAYEQFKTIIDDLKNAAGAMTLTSQVRTSKINLSSEAAYSATSSSAISGSYNISVAQLSQVQKNISEGWSSNTESLLGTGTITVNGTDINITGSNNSISGLAEAINALSDTTGVTATIINNGSDTDPYHLVFTGVDSSTSFSISSNLEDGAGNPIAFSTTQAQTAQQAVVFIDGVKVVSDTNTISSAISGITLNLNELSETSYAGTSENGVDPWDWADPPVYVTNHMRVEPDTNSLKEKLTTFVSGYNKAMDWIRSGYSEFGGATTTTNEDDKEEKFLGSVLRGDASINSIKRGLQSILSTTVNTSGSLSVLSQLGITTQKDGTLRQDNTKLDAALADNYEATVNLLSGEGDVDGVMKNFNYYLLDITSGTNGFYATKKTNYHNIVKRLDNSIRNIEPRMAQKESTLRAQFLAMEQLVSGLNAQGAFLTQQMDMLSKMLTGK
ncbi:MAG TPA: flagellar hook-associated protein 2 [Desulfocapsa sulfexigens]|nr:flagellar hook-associated protein 2 [Desulfocapsa sulfexigens]